MRYLMLLLFLLLLSIPVFADEVTDAAIQREIDRIANADPIEEQIKQLNTLGDDIFIQVKELQFVPMGSEEFVSLSPRESVRIDNYLGYRLFVDIFFDSTFPTIDPAFPIQLYDVRLSVESLDPRYEFKQSWRVNEFSGSSFRKIEVTPLLQLNDGEYAFQVSVSGRDALRRVHTDTQIFYFNVGIEPNNMDISDNVHDTNLRTQERYMVFLTIAIIIIILLGALIFFMWRKFTREGDDY